MGKQKGHGRKRYQPAVNIAKPGTFQEVYSDLFPADAKAVVDRMREFDTAWFEQHPSITRFARKYVPGEAFPQHDPSIRYVEVIRAGNTRARLFSVGKPTGMSWVEIPDEDGGS
jgi:hypothetical protein